MELRGLCKFEWVPGKFVEEIPLIYSCLRFGKFEI